MPVADYQAFMLPVLRAVADGAERSVRDVRKRLAGEFNLSPADRAEDAPEGEAERVRQSGSAGRRPTWRRRGCWRRCASVYRISKADKAVLAEKLDRLDKEYLRRLKPFEE